MTWERTGENYIHSPDKRFYITKGRVAGAVIYTLSDNNVLICTERSDGALERCKARAEELAR